MTINQNNGLCSYLGLVGGVTSVKFRCPIHGDKKASGTASIGKDGRILITCHAGCRIEDILEAWGFSMRDLFQEDNKSERKQKYSPIVATYPYHDAEGNLLYEKVRREDKSFTQRRPDGSGGYIYNRQGVPHVLYRLPEVLQADSWVFIVEGEKDANTITKTGFVSTTGENGAGTGKWLPQYTEQLRGKHCLIIGDHDAVGQAYAQEVTNAIHGVASSVKLLDLAKVWPEIPEHGDVSDMFQAKGQDNALSLLLDLINTTPEWEPSMKLVQREETSVWEEPIPFDTMDAPDFPIESLPAPMAALVNALAESTQTPPEMAGVLALGVMATAHQSKYDLEVTTDWTEPLCLYTVAIAPPGERKSAVISSLTKPIHAYEALRREAEAVETEQNRTERSMLEQRIESAKKSAVKAKGENAFIAQQEVLELVAELAEFKDKHPYRLLVDDITPERLTDVMDTQGGSISIESAEGGLFDSLSGRYDKSANFDIYLKGHAGDPITVDRMGRKANHIKNPKLSMILTIQPEVLTGLMDNATFRGRGLCGRFLYAMCKSKVGRRDSSPPTIPFEVKENYKRFIERILSNQGTGSIRLSQEAQKLRITYSELIESRLGNEWEHMRDWGGKAVGAMLRIAALLHASAVNNPTEIPISSETLTEAVKIAEFLGDHAMVSYQQMGADESLEDAKYLLRRIESTGQDEISKRDLFQLCRGKFKKTEHMEPVLQTLVDMSYIKEVEIGTGERGRPSRKIILNPLHNNHKNLKNAIRN